MTTDPNKDALRRTIGGIVDPEAADEVFADDNEEAAAIFAEAWEVALGKTDLILALPAIALLDEVEAVLEPFAEKASEGDTDTDGEPDPSVPDHMSCWPTFAVGDFRAARDLLTKLQQARGDRG